MRFERTEPFKADYQRLSEEEREMFRAAARAFNAACDRFVETKDPASWPANLRVKAVVNAPGVFEMTWSFSGPDGQDYPTAHVILVSNNPYQLHTLPGIGTRERSLARRGRDSVLPPWCFSRRTTRVGLSKLASPQSVI